MNFKKVIVLPCFLVSLSVFPQSVDHWENLIDAADTWKYTVPVSEPPLNWTDPEFNDAAWNSGQGGFGYGDNDDNTILPLGTISVFIRKNFTVADASKLVSDILFIDYEDAFVVYLNGVEIARANIGTVDIRPAYYATSVNALEPAAASGAIPIRFPVNKTRLASALRNGTNTFAVQFHNHQATSSDLSSTSYFFGGFSNTSTGFRSPPAWFVAPVSVTSHLPLVVIDTWGGYIQNEPKIDAWIKIINNGEGKLNDLNDAGTDYEGNIGIEVRGQSSQGFEKKGYGFETRTPLGEDSAVSLLGMPEESDWILSAPFSDKSLMRNPLTYYLGNTMGEWQPGTRWCELYLNGDYRGVYLLVEKIKRDKDRVNIDKLLPEEIADDPLTGGYIIKVDKLDGLTTNDYFRTIPLTSYFNARHYDFSYVYPKSEDIVPAQKTYIKNYLTDLESALNGTSFKDPVKGFRAYLDEYSFAEFEIMQELSNNVDGYRYSTFFHKENISDGGKLKAGPLWDFDLCYGNVDYAPARLATNTWLYVNYGTNEGSPMHWWRRLMEDPNYKTLVRWRYSQLRAGSLNTDSVFAYLDSTENLLGAAITRNFTRWPILSQYVWPNSYIGGTHDNEMDYLKTWIANRLDWMDSQWLIPLTVSNTGSLEKEFRVFPNPFYSTINVTVKPHNYEDITVSVFSVQGQKVAEQSFTPGTLTSETFILENLSLPSGIYLLQAYQSGLILGNSKLIRTE